MQNATAQRNIAAALVVGGQNFKDPKVVVMVVVVAIVGLLLLMPLARYLGKLSQPASDQGGSASKTSALGATHSRWSSARSVTRSFPSSSTVLLGLLAAISIFTLPALSQVRGVYPPGITATNSGVTPEAGFTYANLFVFYGRDTVRGPNGEIQATGRQSVLMDMNGFVWVSGKQISMLGGPVFSFSATLPIANNSLTSDENGAKSGGGGLADSYYQFILGWRNKRFDVRGIYGFLAPTGRFRAGANDSVGSGYWTHALSSGQTFYLSKNKATSASAFEMYEFHTDQQGTQIHPGDTLNLDYSVTQTFPLKKDLRLQLGLVGYEQLQTTDKTGPNITPEQAAAHYKVHALGFTSNVILPARKVSVGVKYFKEFEDRSTFQGYSLQITASIKF
jgi:hypothetical protein